MNITTMVSLGICYDGWTEGLEEGPVLGGCGRLGWAATYVIFSKHLAILALYIGQCTSSDLGFSALQQGPVMLSQMFININWFRIERGVNSITSSEYNSSFSPHPTIQLSRISIDHDGRVETMISEHWGAVISRYVPLVIWHFNGFYGTLGTSMLSILEYCSRVATIHSASSSFMCMAAFSFLNP
ncbi:hypothetical protein J6590_051197 [Homalodisca vitripennis]|nr:hypothetical protein J6590_051197 [Homalodisca vitripennis]